MLEDAAMSPVVFAVYAHPDDIEFGCAGTLMLLKDAGCQLHYMTVARGDAGSMELSRRQTARVREQEARKAASFLGAQFHPAIANDLEIFYTLQLMQKLLAAVREAAPDIMLVPSPEDYMEDHMNASRLAVTAAFCRAMPNILSRPRRAPVQKDVVLYHALPHGLKDAMRRQPVPDFYVNITEVIDRKEKMLSHHESQKTWLDKTQGMNSYLASMREASAAVGKMSGRFEYAEGWRRHNHLGLSAIETDPLREILKHYVHLV
jgi:LmbE family N-acetylglucosaminyl deacetylase